MYLMKLHCDQGLTPKESHCIFRALVVRKIRYLVPSWSGLLSVHLVGQINGFYPRDAMLARVIVIATCLSVRLSVRLYVCPSVRHAPVLCQNEES